jgi:PilZ domain
MEESQLPNNPTPGELEGLEMPWCKIDEEATLELVGLGSILPGRLVALGLSGCRLRLWQRASEGAPAAVEANFRIHGIAFRLLGQARWTGDGKAAEVRFASMSPRRRDDLIEVLSEMEAMPTADSGQTTRTDPVPHSTLEEARVSDPKTGGPVLVAKSASGAQGGGRADEGPFAPLASGLDAADQGPEPAFGAGDRGPERRADPRSQIETAAVIHLVKVGSKFAGRILNLSLGGCRIHTEKRFPLGIYTRVETEFQVRGLCFRLAGVVQAIHDRDHVGIRFLDLSPRKREQVAELIAEIEELKQRRRDE